MTGASFAHAQSIEGYDYFHMTFPAVSCTQATPGSLSYWAGELANWNSSQTLNVSCPILHGDSPAETIEWLDAYSAGTYQGVTCALKFEHADRTGYSFGPLSRNYGSGDAYEVETFAESGCCTTTPAPMMSLECSIEPGAIFEGYDYDVELINWQY